MDDQFGNLAKQKHVMSPDRMTSQNCCAWTDGTDRQIRRDDEAIDIGVNHLFGCVDVEPWPPSFFNPLTNHHPCTLLLWHLSPPLLLGNCLNLLQLILNQEQYPQPICL